MDDWNILNTRTFIYYTYLPGNKGLHPKSSEGDESSGETEPPEFDQ